MAATKLTNETSPLVEKDGSGGHEPYVRAAVTAGVLPTKWSTPAAIQNPLLGAGVAPTLKALASGGGKVTLVAVDFALSQFADFYLKVRGASAFTAGTSVDLYLLPTINGTVYEDGGDSVTPARIPDARFFVRAVSTQQELVVRYVLLPPFVSHVLLVNNAGQAFTNTDGENLLYYRTYNNLL